MMTVLFLENNDSFSWNVVDRLPFERRKICIVSSPEEALDLRDAARALVIGPGPRDPVRAGIVEVVQEFAKIRVPMLGICLGHQAIGLAFGSRLVRTIPAHGVQSQILFDASRFFRRFDGPLTVMRYHSLALDGVRPPLRVVAAADGVPMAIEHDSLPIAGLQFHPDSFGTPRGEEMLRSFFDVAMEGRN